MDLEVGDYKRADEDRRRTLSGFLKQAAKRSHIREVFELKDCGDKQLRGGRAEDGLDEVAGFGDDFFTAHLILGGTADGVDVLGEEGSIVEEDLDGGLAGGETLLELFISEQGDLGSLTEDGGVLHESGVVG
jgi:hypothetical protein